MSPRGWKIAFGLSFVPTVMLYRYFFPSLERMGSRGLEETGWGVPFPIFLCATIGIATVEGILAYFAFRRQKPTPDIM